MTGVRASTRSSRAKLGKLVRPLAAPLRPAVALRGVVQPRDPAQTTMLAPRVAGRRNHPGTRHSMERFCDTAISSCSQWIAAAGDSALREMFSKKIAGLISTPSADRGAAASASRHG